MKSLKPQLLVIECFLVCLCSYARAQYTLDPGNTQTGAISSAPQINTYSFTASAGDVFDFTAVATSGSLSPQIQVYNSEGMVIARAANYLCSGSTIELNTVLIPANGTYTVDVSDCSDTNTGNYVLYSQRINNPNGAVNLPFGQTLTGMIGSAAQSNTYTFSANAGDTVDFTLTTTTSGGLSPKIRLYSQTPVGLVGSAANYLCSGSTIELNTVTIPTTGTYTVLVGDCSDTNTASYEIYAQRTDNPGLPVVPLLPGQTQTGTIPSAATNNTYTFSANANDVFDFTAVTTIGSLSPKIRLYNPDGSLLSSAANYLCSGSTIEMNTVTLKQKGTYTLLVADCSDTNTGDYAFYSQRINNPGGIVVPLPFGQTLTGMIGSAAQSNTYTFSANAGDRVDFTLTATSGSLSPKIRLYSQSPVALVGSAANYLCSGSTIELNTVTIPVTGTYTVLVGDCSDTNTGNYAIYSQRTNNPTVPVAVDWGTVQSGKISSAAQSNTYTFGGGANNVVDFTTVTTSGNLSPKIRLYNPDGSLLSSAANYLCSGSTIQLSSVTLTQNGNYTVLLGDCSDTNTGNYSLSSLCFGTCPNITGISPNYGADYAIITLTGANFGASQGASTVTFNGAVAAPTAWANNSIKVPVPFHATTGNIVVMVGGIPSNGVPFTVEPSPSISGISPSSGPAGTLVTISGQNLLDAEGHGAVYFGGVSLPILNPSSTSVQVEVPAGATSGVFDVHINGVGNNTPTFTVTPPPQITSLSPNYGADYATITLTGTNFGASQGASTVTFNGTPAAPTAWSNTSITVTVPYHASTGNIVVTVGGISSNGIAFTVEPSPSISGISPSSGPAGTLVTISGQNLLDAEGHGAVYFGGVSLPILNPSSTSVQVEVPAGATSGVFDVHINGVGINTPTFTVTPPPQIASLSANYGADYAIITLTGANFGTSQGTSAVTFNGAVAVATAWANTSITVTVPYHASTGNIIVTVAGEASNGIAFTVEPSPSISGISPSSGPVGTLVTISGQNLLDAKGHGAVYFGGVSLPILNPSSTSIQVTIPVDATSGVFDVHTNGVGINTPTFTVN